MRPTENSGVRRISANLPQELIEGVDELKKEWGLRSRGLVLERLLENIFLDNEGVNPQELSLNSTEVESLSSHNNSHQYNEDKAIVLIGKSQIEIQEDLTKKEIETNNPRITQSVSQSVGIDLPGFVSKRTNNLKQSLRSKTIKSSDIDSCLNTIRSTDITSSMKCAIDHWIALYGKKPADNVVEAAMIWLARDIWPHIDGSENKSFTWSIANKLMGEYCSTWLTQQPNFERVIVIAGLLEDPFSSNTLEKRVPTIIRRFVSSFKRRQNVTSFQTIESTMTVHGALKLLGLPTKAGSSLTLNSVRESYKQKALENHPDSGGSTEAMRKLNEAYQLLKELYKEK